MQKKEFQELTRSIVTNFHSTDNDRSGVNSDSLISITFKQKWLLKAIKTSCPDNLSTKNITFFSDLVKYLNLKKRGPKWFESPVVLKTSHMLLSRGRPDGQIIALCRSGFLVSGLELQRLVARRIVDPKAEQRAGFRAERAVEFRRADSVIAENHREALAAREVTTFIVHGTPHLVRYDALILLLFGKNSNGPPNKLSEAKEKPQDRELSGGRVAVVMKDCST